MAKNDVQHKVLRGCRAGDRDALQAAAYQLADELYTAAMSALDNDELAREAVVESWRRLLAALRGWRFTGGLRQQALRILQKLLSQSSGPSQRCIKSIMDRGGPDDSQILSAPDKLVERLVVEGERTANSLQRTAHRRRYSLFVALTIGAFAIGILIGFGNTLYGRALSVHSPELQFEMLQQRIVGAELPLAVHEAYLSMMDVEGAQAGQAEALQRIGLVLEEIVNAANLQETGHLQFIKQRISAQQLIQKAHAITEKSRGKQQEKLALVVLTLEEAANL